MGRPKKQEHEKRTERQNLRFTVAEIVHIQQQADAAGISPAEYVRRRALGYTVPSGSSSRGTDPALISELNRVGVNVNQLARSVHRGGDFVQYWQEIGQELRSVLEAVVRNQEDS
ncbi:MAG: plasmid mobilization relaxosome protein MobC [Candidatus Hydrogenedentes bacterium]|nr:plasmid mobilization relaxosome protein MobC [Candidatus Hydrogenedentota bacterium]